MGRNESKQAHPPGMYWAVHHDLELEWCHDYRERVEFIETKKLQHERAARLRWFQRVRGRLPRELVDAARAYNRARTAYDRAWAAYKRARTACDRAWAAYNQADRAYEQAAAAYRRMINNHQPAITELHRIEQPDSPWKGTELLLPKRSSAGEIA